MNLGIRVGENSSKILYTNVSFGRGKIVFLSIVTNLVNNAFSIILFFSINIPKKFLNLNYHKIPISQPTNSVHLIKFTWRL